MKLFGSCWKYRKDVLNMCYKDEVQRKNTEKLNKKFEQDNTPGFIQITMYFIVC